MESGETPKQGKLNIRLDTDERPPLILGTDQLVIQTDEGPRVKDINIVATEENYRFKAVDPITGLDIPLTKTKIASLYRSMLNEEPPRHLTEGLELQARIRKAKSKKRK